MGKTDFLLGKGKRNEKSMCLARSSGAGKSVGIVYSAEAAGEPMTRNHFQPGRHITPCLPAKTLFGHTGCLLIIFFCGCGSEINLFALLTASSVVAT